MGNTESKLLARKHVLRLVDKSNVIDDDDINYWCFFWREKWSLMAIIETLSPADIRYIRDTNMPNFARLISVLTSRVVYLSSLKNIPLADFPVDEVLNCLRLLTRILPFLYEKEKSAALEDSIFWSLNSKALKIATSKPVTYFSPVAELEPTEKPPAASCTTVKFDSILYDDRPIGAKLMIVSVNLLFTLGFTVDENDKRLNKQQIIYANDVQHILWEAGIGESTIYSNPKIENDSNRLEVLRLILVLCSKGLYKQYDNVVSSGSRFLTVLVTSIDKPIFSTLCASLINLACRSTKTNMDATNMNGLDLPTETQKKIRLVMVTNSIQLLTLMIVYLIPKGDTNFLYNLNILIPKKDNLLPPKNLARVFCGRIQKTTELELVTKNLLRPLLKQMNDESTLSYIMKSSKMIDEQPIDIWGTEMLMLVTEFFQCNSKFRVFVAELIGSRFVVLLLFYIIKLLNDDRYKNFVRLCGYLMLNLTSDINIAKKLMRPMDPHYYNSLPQGFRVQSPPSTFRDFIVIHLCNSISANTPNIMLPTLVEILYNLIPMQIAIKCESDNDSASLLSNRKLSIKDITKCPPNQLSYAASSNIIQLISRLSSSQFLNSDSDNRLDYLTLILRGCCQSIIRDPSDSVILIYVLAKNMTSILRISNNLKRVSDQQYEDQLAEEKKNDDEANAAQLFPNSGFNQIQPTLSSRASTEIMPPLSRQSTANTLESISRMPQPTRQLSQMSNHSLNSSPAMKAIDEFGSLERVNSHKTDSISRRGSVDEHLKFESAIYPSDDGLLYPHMPIGMSEEFKGKKNKFDSLEDRWSGKASLDLILQILNPVSKYITSSSTSSSDAASMISSLGKCGIEKIIENIKSIDLEFDSKITNFQMLKPRWSYDALGWYNSVLWSCIFLNFEIYTSKGFLADINSGITAIKKVSSSWGFWNRSSNRNTGDDNSFDDLNLYQTKINEQLEGNLFSLSLWFGTHIELFRVNPTIMKEHFILQHGKSDLISSAAGISPVLPNGFWKKQHYSRNGSGVFTEGFWKRQGGRPSSISSLDRRDSVESLLRKGVISR
ncbi:hypothetical protein DAMA08_042400 [Martiniozyma asiatica (nom. inval.)]|nr:hypothetical protein DAMA08_042400 [Martiniozyma asiatica]